MPELETAIEKSARWMAQAASLIDGLSFDTSDRNRLSESLLHLCIEHHTGIHTLVDHGVCGSAFALIRPQLEAYVRGVWYGLCATDADVAKFLAGSEPPRMDILIKNMEANGAFSDGSLGRMKETLWGTLCAFTHGGLIQVLARNTHNEIVQSYKLPHVAGLVTSSAILSNLACLGMAAVMDLQPFSVRVREAFQVIYGKRVVGDGGCH